MDHEQDAAAGRPSTPVNTMSDGQDVTPPQKPTKKRRAPVLVRPTPVKKPYVGEMTARQTTGGQQHCASCRVVLKDGTPRLEFHCDYISVLKLNIERDSSQLQTDEAKRLYQKYVKFAVATSQVCESNRSAVKLLLVKPHSCGAVCCLNCVPEPRPLQPADFSQSKRWIYARGVPKCLAMVQHKCPTCHKPASLVLKHPHTYFATKGENAPTRVGHTTGETDDGLDPSEP